MEYIELELQFDDPQWEEILVAELSEIGFYSFRGGQRKLLAYIREKEFTEQRLMDCFFINQNKEKIKFDKRIIKSENWNSKWEENFDPVDVENKIYVRAPFHEAKPGPMEILIMPKMAFGTGHHATTYLMLKQMLEMELKNKTVADLGCGSGILAIAASKLEAAHVSAVDIDEWAYTNTLENAEANNVKNMVIKQGTAVVLDQKFDVVLANINRNVLMAEMNLYSELLHDNGLLLVSGFYTEDKSMIESAAIEQGFEHKNEMGRSNWLSVLFYKR
jgi:ribosomal protein L11 methyltransferase